MDDYARMLATQQARQYAKPYDPTPVDIRDTALATKESRELIEQLVEHAIATANAAEVRERQMLRWTQAGVVLAGIAAVASVVAIIVTVLVGG